MRKMRVGALLGIAFLAAIPVFGNRDSIGVKQLNSRLFILHKVDKGQGLMAIGRRYNVSVAEIETANPEVKNGIYPGQVVLVPAKTPPTKPDLNKSETPPKKPVVQIPPKKDQPKVSGNAPIYHTVVAGETLYRIAVNSKSKVEDIVKWNGIAGNNISVGQTLIVGYRGKPETDNSVSQDPKPDKTLPKKNNTTKTTDKTDEPKFVVDNGSKNPDVNPSGERIDTRFQDEYSAYEKRANDKKKSGQVVIKEVQEKSTVGWIDDGSVVSEKNLALHKSAPPGTIIQLTNPMNGRTVYVKVIGKLPASDVAQNMDLKITKTAADKLGAIDKIFLVDAHYSMEVIK